MSGLIERIDINLAGTSFTDELHSNVGASAFALNHDWFWGGDDLIIRDAAGGGGALLVEGVNYDLSVDDADLTARSGKTVRSRITITTGGYQSGNLYFSGEYIADSNEAEDINYALGLALIDTSAKWQRNILHSMFVSEVRAWHKSLCAKMFSTQITTGTADTNRVDHLEDTGGDFSGVSVGDIVYNSTDNVYATVTGVTSGTVLTLDWDAFPDGDEGYGIHDEPELPEQIVECNGQTISDAESAMNGFIVEDLNGDERFLRGSLTSGIEQADAFQGHTPKFNSTGGTYSGDVDELLIRNSSGDYTPTSTEAQIMTSSGGSVRARGNFSNLDTDGVNGTPRVGSETRPINMTMVWIMRIK